ncbi:AraC family transcriptional regulator [Streptomyces sp. ISL-43]|uniref:AraC family transcriptional regulator n=1 Tax=Streptomyces sp. ISL-43 TaxID=2819183 RepID=UPI001BE82DFF|nr:AraC family transcriptional regulator [Streptomyces sp. ISL-43]MBT2452770.1 AraC family transcriptional regulator [Streptomyces sp. ISL-43]
MDILSDTLAALRTGRPSAVCTEARGPWGFRVQAIVGAAFHVVGEGRCLLVPLAGDPIELGAGDVVFLRRSSGHVLTDSLSSPVVDFDPVPVNAGSPIGYLVADGVGARTRLLCGAYKLDVDHRHPLLRELPEVIHLPARPGRHPALRATVDQLCVEMNAPRPGSDAVVRSLMDLLLVYILRCWYDEQSRERAGGWAAALTDPVIAPALHAIHEDPGHPWTVESLGGRAGLSRAAFARRFTAVVGDPPLSYLTTWRMTTAGRLLRDGDLSLSTVAANTGYTSELAFAKAFKRHFGTPPGAYRREARA